MVPSSDHSSLNLAAHNRVPADQIGQSSPVKQRHSMASITSQGSLEYQPGELPTDFHRKVVDLEIKVEMNGVSQHNNE